MLRQIFSEAEPSLRVLRPVKLLVQRPLLSPYGAARYLRELELLLRPLLLHRPVWQYPPISSPNWQWLFNKACVPLLPNHRPWNAPWQV